VSVCYFDFYSQELEKQEEAKLNTRYPGAMKPMAGHSAFLQKRLAKGQKYFDSGDYQMAKQTGKSNVSYSCMQYVNVVFMYF